MVQPHFNRTKFESNQQSELEPLLLPEANKVRAMPVHPDNSIEHNTDTVENEPIKSVLHGSIPSLSSSHWSGQTNKYQKWNVYLGDARDVLASLPDNSFQCAITSPPYYWLRDYGVEGQIGQEWKISDYVEAIADVMDQVRRVLASDGLLFLNIGDTYYSGKGQSQGIDKKSSKRRFGLRAVDASGLGIPQKSLIGIPWRVAIELIDRGWILRSSLIWDRMHALPESVKDRPGRTYEYIFMFAKSRKYYFNQKALNGQKDDIWTIKVRPKATPGISTAPFPDELAQKCIDIGCASNSNVLDPFAGSGTTLRVALESGHNATGIDINPEFCKYMVDSLLGI